MVAVRWLEPDVAEDLALAPAVVDVVNRADAHKEVGLFATKDRYRRRPHVDIAP